MVRLFHVLINSYGENAEFSIVSLCSNLQECNCNIKWGINCAQRNKRLRRLMCRYVRNKTVCLWSHSNTELLSQNDSEQEIIGK